MYITPSSTSFFGEHNYSPQNSISISSIIST